MHVFQQLTHIWGLKDASNILAETLKSQLCGSPLDFVLQVAFKASCGALWRLIRN